MKRKIEGKKFMFFRFKKEERGKKFETCPPGFELSYVECKSDVLTTSPMVLCMYKFVLNNFYFLLPHFLVVHSID